MSDATKIRPGGFDAPALKISAETLARYENLANAIRGGKAS